MLPPEIHLLLTFGILALGIFLFVKEYFTVDTTAIIIMALLIVTGILSPQEGFAGFNNPAVITVASMFVLSHAVFKTGLLGGFSNLLLRIGNRSSYLAMVFLVISATVISAFINVTAIVTMFLPVVMKLGEETDTRPGKLLMPLSFGALLGGVVTLVGTSTNILVSSIAETNGVEPFTMFEFTRTGLWITGIGLLYLFTVGYALLPYSGAENKDRLSKMVASYVIQIRLKEGSPDHGKTIENSNLNRKYRAKVLQIENEGRRYVSYLKYQLQQGEKLTLSASQANIQKIYQDPGYEINNEYQWSAESLRSAAQKLVEVLIPAGSSLAGYTLQELDFIRRYNSTVLALRHLKDTEANLTELSSTRLKSGDIMLVLADEDQIRELFDKKDLMLLTDDYKPVQQDYKKALLVLGIIVGVITSAALGLTSIVISAMIGCLLLVLLRIVEPQEAYRAVEWKVIFMLAGVISMGTAIQKTGGADLIARQIQTNMNDLGPGFILSFIFLCTMLLTNVMSNTATAALMAPIAISVARSLELNEKPFLLAIMFAASMAFMTPMGYQTNAIVYSPGGYKFQDYVRVGTPLNILIWILASILIPIYFPFQKC